MHRAWLTSDVASGFNESIYYHDPVSTRHTDAAAALKAVYGGELGQPISPSIFSTKRSR